MSIQTYAPQVLNQLKTGVLLCDEKQNIVFVNQTLKNEFHVQKAEGQSLTVFFGTLNANPQAKEKIILSAKNVLAMQSDVDPVELHLSTDQRYQIFFSPVEITEEKQRYCAMTFERAALDDSQIKALTLAKEKAEQSSKQKTSFLTNFSYQIRTSLHSILGYGQLLQDELLEVLTAEQQYYMNSLHWGSTQLYDTISRIYDIARIESGEFTVSCSPFSIKKALAETVMLLQPFATEKNLALKMGNIAENLSVIVDSSCLSRVFANLIDTSIKYTDAGSITIEVSNGKNSESVQIKITDTGIGLPNELLPSLHEAFHVGNPELMGGHEETALTIALTKKYLDLMGGTITIETSNGIGTTYTVTLRRAEVEPIMQESVEPTIAPRPVEPSLEKPLVLLVEDHEDAQMLVKAFLRDKYTVLIASDADEALEILHKVEPSLILMDVALSTPQGGLDLTMELRLNPKYNSTPIIALTAFAMPGDRERFLGAGMNDYLSKPYKKNDLTTMVEKWLGKQLQPTAA